MLKTGSFKNEGKMKKTVLFLLVALVFSGATKVSAQGWLKKALDKVDKTLDKVDKALQPGQTSGTNQEGQKTQLPENYQALAENMKQYPDGTLSFTHYRLDADCKKIVLKKYTTDYQFRDGMLAVKNGETGKWGFFNERGEQVIDFIWEYNTSGTPAFGGGACAVCKSVRQYVVQWHVIDKTGKEKAFPVGSTISGFCDGYAIVRETNGHIHKRYYINNKGERVFPHLDEETYANDDLRDPRPFKDGLAAYYSYTKKLYGYIDTTGKVVVEPRFTRAYDFSEGLAIVLVPGTGTTPARYGYIDTSGNMAIEAKFSEEVLPFHDGYAAVQKTNGKVVFIDRQGNVASPEYRDARRFCNGYAFVEVEYNDIRVINTQFEEIRQFKHEAMDSFFPIRSGSSGSFDDPFVLLEFGNYVARQRSGWGPVVYSRLYTADGQPFIDMSDLGNIAINAFYGKLAHRGNGIIDFEKSLQTGVAHYVILFTEPEF
jgi:hypothetical protein